MIHLTRKRKNYIRPEAEATWMDNEDLMQGITGSVPDEPWGNAKGNKISLLDPDGDEPDPKDDGWGLYFGYDFDE